AFIMDGNGRWAQKKGLARLKGHSEGTATVKRVIEDLKNHGVKVATFYAFSTENWKRSTEEVSGLFDLMRLWFRKELNEIIAKGVRIRFIGNRTDGKLAPDILSLMEEVEARTAHLSTITAIFAINYSGRDELTRAAQKSAQTGQPLQECLDTAGYPDPDLVIRTSGEQRLSNFLLWQLAYAELYFTDVSWPDFSSTHLQAALSSFLTRQRRFGAVPATPAA
ncbi:MAG: polyprenyl diphosphate synthase, partial [Lentisphaeria bacterium]